MQNVVLRRSKTGTIDGKPIVDLPPRLVQLVKAREFIGRLVADRVAAAAEVQSNRVAASASVSTARVQPLCCCAHSPLVPWFATPCAAFSPEERTFYNHLKEEAAQEIKVGCGSAGVCWGVLRCGAL